MKGIISYSQLIFTMEFLMSYCINVLPMLNLQRIGVVSSLVLFFVHSFVSIRHNMSNK